MVKLHSLGILFSLVLLSACGNVFERRGKLNFNTKEMNALEQEKIKQAREEEKQKSWQNITQEARVSYELVRPIFEKKCSSCHDANFQMPLYGKILPSMNPVAKHQEDGLKALDISEVFPLKQRDIQVS